MRMRPGAWQVLQRAKVFLIGEAVRRSLTGLARAVTVDSLARMEPRCVPTQARGQRQRVEVAFGNGSFQN
ncbi:hypothetical protein [uncultured Jannaschia sp.]|uniref:hypothetical protein n=1 Tax=uncultured Jannaschia sp. TaxID=293347 RepID=UPI00262FE708|nr:hypothetical protein [uncultured Jannaschia sp.]